MVTPNHSSAWRFSDRTFVSIFVLVVFFYQFLSVDARRNVTIDEGSPLITYYPASSWSQVTGDLDAGGGHMMTQDPNGYATLTYTFVSFWVMSTKWPYEVTTEYVIDGTRRTILDFQDHSMSNVGGGGGTVASSIVGSFIGTSSRQHEITLHVPAGGQFAVLDRLIFEVEDDISTSQTIRTQTVVSPTTISQSGPDESTAVPSQTSAAVSGSSSSSTRNLSIALGIVGPLLALLILFLIWWFLLRGRPRTPENPPPLSYPYEREKSMYISGDGPIYGVATPGLHAASYDASNGLGGYVTPTGPYVPYVPSPSSTPGIAGIGAATAYPQTHRPPYPEIPDIPQPYNPYAQAGAGFPPAYGVQSNMDGAEGRSSWVPSNSVYSTNTGDGIKS